MPPVAASFFMALIMEFTVRCLKQYRETMEDSLLEFPYFDTTLVIQKCLDWIETSCYSSGITFDPAVHLQEVSLHMPTVSRVSTTDMEVTSIRLERELKDKLKAIAGDRGYQALIRDVLWQYVEQLSQPEGATISATDIRFSLEAIAHCEERCALTGRVIQPQEPIRLGLTTQGVWVPISCGSLEGA